MDSIKTRIVNAPQMSGIQTLAFDRVDEDGNTINDFAVSTSTLRHILIPEGAYVTGAHVVCDTALAGEGASTIVIGIPAGTSQVDGTSAVSASANAIMASFNLASAAAGAHNASSCWVYPGTTVSDTYSSSGEKVVAVEAKVAVATSAATAGKVHWWIEYAFMPNIVWDQDTI